MLYDLTESLPRKMPIYAHFSLRFVTFLTWLCIAMLLKDHSHYAENLTAMKLLINDVEGELDRFGFHIEILRIYWFNFIEGLSII